MTQSSSEAHVYYLFHYCDDHEKENKVIVELQTLSLNLWHSWYQNRVNRNFMQLVYNHACKSTIMYNVSTYCIYVVCNWNAGSSQ